MYDILLQLTKEDMVRPRWKIDIGESISKQDWERVNHFGQQLSLNVRIREKRYEIINGWYYTRLMTIKSVPRCFLSMLEMWSSIFLAQMGVVKINKINKTIPFWKQLDNKMQQILKISLPYTPRLLLLDTLKKNIRSVHLIANMLTAATQLNAGNWKSDTVPSVHGWLYKVKHVYL